MPCWWALAEESACPGPVLSVAKIARRGKFRLSPKWTAYDSTAASRTAVPARRGCQIVDAAVATSSKRPPTRVKVRPSWTWSQAVVGRRSRSWLQDGPGGAASPRSASAPEWSDVVDLDPVTTVGAVEQKELRIVRHGPPRIDVGLADLFPAARALVAHVKPLVAGDVLSTHVSGGPKAAVAPTRASDRPEQLRLREHRPPRWRSAFPPPCPRGR